MCTLDRTPRLYRQAAEVRVVQPDPFYDPTLPDRAAMTGMDAADVRAALRGQRFRVREAEVNGTHYLYGDRHRWTKLATLMTHLGLILFLSPAVVTSRLGDEQGLVIAAGDSLTVQPIGTPGLLVVKNYGFEAPGLLETGQATDFTTDLGVFQNGQEVARKTIRVNDPLAVDGYTFHQNGFGPAPDLLITDANGQAALGRAGAADRHRRGPPVRHDVRAGPGRRPRAAARPGRRRGRQPPGRCRTR